jgi:hypothetical protein
MGQTTSDFTMLKNYLKIAARNLLRHKGYTFLTGGLALVVALLTVSAQAIRAALANPVEALRYE